MENFEVILKGFGLIMIMMTLLWIYSVKVKNASIIDPFWGVGFLVLSLWYTYASGNFTTRSIILLLLVSAWSIRLFSYLYLRNKGKGEDHRYQNFRKAFGSDRYWWFSFFQVFLLQGILMLFVSLPLFSSAVNELNKNIGAFEFIGGIIFIIGFLFESIGDYQLTVFKSNPANRNKVLTSGLWKYTRHPNYFGESLIWWGFGIYSLGTGVIWPLAGSALMMFLLLKVSGVTLLEKTLTISKPEYSAYKMNTSAFFPWFPTNK